MKISRTGLAVALATTLGLAGSVVALPAQAATCSGSSCEGKSPVTYGCSSDAVTIDDIKLRDHYTRLRYSKKCKAYWAQATASAVGPADKFRVESVDYINVPPTMRIRKSYTSYVSNVSSYTAMVRSSDDARACEYDYLADDKKYCTNFS